MDEEGRYTKGDNDITEMPNFEGVTGEEEVDQDATTAIEGLGIDEPNQEALGPKAEETQIPVSSSGIEVDLPLEGMSGSPALEEGERFDEDQDGEILEEEEKPSFEFAKKGTKGKVEREFSPPKAQAAAGCVLLGVLLLLTTQYFDSFDANKVSEWIADTKVSKLVVSVRERIAIKEDLESVVDPVQEEPEEKVTWTNISGSDTTQMGEFVPPPLPKTPTSPSGKAEMAADLEEGGLKPYITKDDLEKMKLGLLQEIGPINTRLDEIDGDLEALNGTKDSHTAEIKGLSDRIDTVVYTGDQLEEVLRTISDEVEELRKALQAEPIQEKPMEETTVGLEEELRPIIKEIIGELVKVEVAEGIAEEKAMIAALEKARRDGELVIFPVE